MIDHYEVQALRAIVERQKADIEWWKRQHAELVKALELLAAAKKAEAVSYAA